MKNENLVYVLIFILVVFISKDFFLTATSTKEVNYSEKEVSLILKVERLNNQIKELKIESQIIEKDNERINKNITIDSVVIYDSSRKYRDSLRSVYFSK